MPLNLAHSIIAEDCHSSTEINGALIIYACSYSIYHRRTNKSWNSEWQWATKYNIKTFYKWWLIKKIRTTHTYILIALARTIMLPFLSYMPLSQNKVWLAIPLQSSSRVDIGRSEEVLSWLQLGGKQLNFLTSSVNAQGSHLCHCDHHLWICPYMYMCKK